MVSRSSPLGPIGAGCSLSVLTLSESCMAPPAVTYFFLYVLCPSLMRPPALRLRLSGSTNLARHNTETFYAAKEQAGFLVRGDVHPDRPGIRGWGHPIQHGHFRPHGPRLLPFLAGHLDRKSTRLNSSH